MVTRVMKKSRIMLSSKRMWEKMNPSIAESVRIREETVIKVISIRRLSVMSTS